MTDRELFTLLKALLDASWSVVYPDDPDPPMVLQAWQPDAQGIASGPALYLAKIGDRRYGSPSRTTEPDPDDVNGVIRIETQVYESTFQVMGIWERTEDPPYTASDLTNRAAAVLQSDYGLDHLRAGGAGMQRITDVRNPKFVNGSDEYEASPNFDFVLTHKQVTLTKNPAAKGVLYRQYPI